MSLTAPTGSKAPRAPRPAATRPRTTRYLVTLWGCVDPALEGPFATDRDRVKAARAWKRDGNGDGAVMRLDIDAKGQPHIGCFTGDELPEHGDAD